MSGVGASELIVEAMDEVVRQEVRLVRARRVFYESVRCGSGTVSQSEIGRLTGLTRQRIHQIVKGA